jgi:hypothetical protein
VAQEAVAVAVVAAALVVEASMLGFSPGLAAEEEEEERVVEEMVRAWNKGETEEKDPIGIIELQNRRPSRVSCFLDVWKKKKWVQWEGYDRSIQWWFQKREPVWRLVSIDWEATSLVPNGSFSFPACSLDPEYQEVHPVLES